MFIGDPTSMDDIRKNLRILESPISDDQILRERNSGGVPTRSIEDIVDREERREYDKEDTSSDYTDSKNILTSGYLTPTLERFLSEYTMLGNDIDPHIDTYPMAFFVKPMIPAFGYDGERVSENFKSSKPMLELENKHFNFLNNRLKNELKGNNWIKGYTKMFKSMDIPSLGMNIESTVTNKQKERYMQPTFFTGQSGGTINVSLMDDIELSNMKVTKAWYDYIKLVTSGRILPPRVWALNNIANYKSSIYFLGVSPNFRSVRYFGKFTGVQPTNIPFSNLDFNRENVGLKSFDFEMSYDYFECLDEDLIPDFNNFGSSLGLTISKESGTGNYVLEADI